MALGFVLMVFGMLGYTGSVLFTLMIDPRDIDDLRLATLMSFLSVMSFMMGSILEVKDLTYSREQYKHAKVRKRYLTDLQRNVISYLLIVTIISMIVLLVCLLALGF